MKTVLVVMDPINVCCRRLAHWLCSNPLPLRHTRPPHLAVCASGTSGYLYWPVVDDGVQTQHVDARKRIA